MSFFKIKLGKWMVSEKINPSFVWGCGRKIPSYGSLFVITLQTSWCRNSIIIMDSFANITYMRGSSLSPHTYLSMILNCNDLNEWYWEMTPEHDRPFSSELTIKKFQNPGSIFLSRLVSRWYRMHLPVYILIVYQNYRLSQKHDIPFSCLKK